MNADPSPDPLLAEFVELRAPRARALVRRGHERDAERLGLAGDPPGAAASESGGRAPHPVVELSGGSVALVRRYHRGGAMRHLNRTRYFLGHRAFHELRVTELARAAGVRAPVVLAAVERRHRLGYDAWLATLWIPGADELVAWLVAASSRAGEAAMQEVGRQVGLMHGGGIAHPDLNLRNVLVTAGDMGHPAIHLIDFDRGRMFAGPVPEWRRRRDLQRLARSARKLGALVPPRAWEAFRAGYGPAWPSAVDLG